MAEGIDVRHRRACATKIRAKRCTCKPTYQAHVFDARQGKRIRKTFTTVSGAKLWRQDALRALRTGDLRPATGTTVAAALDALLAGMRDGTVLDRSGRRYRPATVRSYDQATRNYLVPALGALRLTDVRRRDVQALVDRMHAQGLGGSTIRNKLDPLRVVYRRALEDDVVTRNPVERLRLPANVATPRKVANVERAGELLPALPDGERAAWACAFYAGLRVGELRALRWGAVDFDAGVIRVVAGWDDQEGEQDTKTAAGARTVPLVGRLRVELARHKLATVADEDALCFGRTPRQVFVRSTLRSRALRAWQAAGLEPLSSHEARHCCASYLAAAGLSPKEAQTAMGHADIRTTLNIYAKAVPGWESGAVAKLDAYLEAPAALDVG